MSGSGHLPDSSFPAEEPIERRLATALAKIGIALRHGAWQEGFAEDLSPTQGQVLTLLHRRPGASLSQLADVLAVRPATASEAVRVLVEKGLVEKSRDPHDRRTLRLALTREGAQKAGRVAGWPDFLERALGDLVLDEQQVMMRAFQRIIVQLQERGEIPLAHMCASCVHFRPQVHASSDRPHHCAFVDAAMSDGDLRFECADHELAEAPRLAQVRELLANPH
ncbi:MAG: MarR family transcriptional regulator [Acidobacteriota bacterium]